MKRRDILTALALAAVCAALAFAPSPPTVAQDSGTSVRARVVATDDGKVELAGLVEYGTQHLTVEPLEGPGKGRRFRAENELRVSWIKTVPLDWIYGGTD